MQEQWINKAALYEVLSLGFLFTSKDLAQALARGEYAEALDEIAGLNGLDTEAVHIARTELTSYTGEDADELFHELRAEYTYLFIGSPDPGVSPFAGIWYTEEIGVEPLMFVNKESMAVERFMRSCDVGQPEGINEPLDHIGSELEFLQYLCLLRAGVLKPSGIIEFPEGAYEEFYRTHFSAFSKKFAHRTVEKSRIPFFRAVARILQALPEHPL